MSKADPEEVSVVVERDGIRVEKTFEPEDFPVPAIAFAINSERDEPVDVRLVDQVPDEIPAEDIGFHPKYGAEFWSVEGETIVFEREFEAGEEYTTVYGLRARDTDQVERFLGEPDLERVDPEREDSSQAVRDVIGDLDLDDETDDTDPETDDEPVEPLELDDPTETSGSPERSSDGAEAAVSSVESETDDVESAVSAVEPETESETVTETETETEPEIEAPDGEAEPAIVDVSGERVPPEDVASALAAELREGQVPESDLRALREALDVDPSGSDRARIQRIQRDVSDLRAYTDALEAFLDEQGEAQTLLRELRGEIDGLEERIRAVDTRVETVANHAETAADRVDEVDAELDDVAASVDELGEELEGMEKRVAAIEDGLGDVDAVDERLADIEEDLEGLRSVEDRMEELDDRLEEAHTDLQELARMRDQLSSVFGAGQTGGEGRTDETDAGDDA